MIEMTSFDRAKKVQELNRVPCGTAAIIMSPDMKLLMIKRSGTGHGNNTWSVPGGWVDAGEDPQTGVMREIEEEVGIIMSPDRGVFRGYTYDQHPEGIEDICLWFWFANVSRNPRIMEPDKISELAWITPGAWPDPLFPPFKEAIEAGLLGKWSIY